MFKLYSLKIAKIEKKKNEDNKHEFFFLIHFS